MPGQDKVAVASEGNVEFRTRVEGSLDRGDALMLGASVKDSLDRDPNTRNRIGRDADGSLVEIDLSKTFLNASNRVAATGFAKITELDGDVRTGPFYYSEGPSGMSGPK